VIKVIHAISDTNIGGAGRWILTFLSEVNTKEFDIKIILPEESKLIPELEKLKANYFAVPGMADKSFDRLVIGKIKKILKAEKPDIVHAHAAISARIAAYLAGVKRITYTRHSVFEPKRSLKKGAGRAANKFMDGMTATRIIAVANAAKKNVTDTGIKPDKIEVIYNGVKPLERYSEKQISELKKSLKIPKDVPIIALTARITEVKGQDYFIKSAKILKDSGYDARFVIAGTGDKEDEFRSLAKKLDLEDYVIFTGFLKDITGLMNAMDIQANASFGTEAASLSLMEGMSLGKPSVVTNYGGNPELITDGYNGYVIPQKDEGAMALAIISLLEDKKLYDKMSKNALEVYNKRFTAKGMTLNIEKFYRELMKGGSAK
jgi:glycosyltransferase involved in cell wall biosynthesis